ncbi:MAG: hypothetical protein JXR68_04085 [Bacteroidales bacterium]|nr:hypothetical protein [Bacteroidales bacterium]
MKKFYPLLGLLIFFTVISSCKILAQKQTVVGNIEKVQGDSLLSYEESLKKWEALKRVNGNSYVYQISFASWTGYGNLTEITVKDGIVTNRKYESFKYDHKKNKRIINNTYTENINNLGSNSEGAAALTIDQLYETCAKNYLTVDPSENEIYFETTDYGLMTTCGYYPFGCADDCYRGISISAFEWIIN